MLVILISFSVKYLDIKGENQFPKKQSISHIIELPEAFDLLIFGVLETLKRNLSISDKNIFLGLSNVDWTTCLFQTVFKKKFKTLIF